MNKIFLIAKRDFKQIVTSPLFFLVAAMATIIWSITYLGALRQFASQGLMASMQGGGPHKQSLFESVFVQHLSIVNLVMIFTLPALTMRLIAEEKKSRSYDLLLTSPISSTQIAVGKYLAGFLACMVLVAISFIYPAGTALIATFSWKTLFALYLGLTLVCALYVASGLFASSLTESAMLAVFMGVVFNLLVWFVGQMGMGSDIQWLANVTEYMSVGQHLMGFVRGTVRTSSLVFFITAICFFIFLSQRVVESARWR